MSTITTIDATDNVSDSRSDINTNFSNLNTDKLETVATTDVAAGNKTGSDTKFVTGTAGSSGNLAEWNGDGDAVDSSLATADVVTGSSTDTFTNKTFDANGTGNSLSNVEVADLAGSAVVTESEGISSNDNDTTFPTSAAVKDYVDTNAANKYLLAGVMRTQINSSQTRYMTVGNVDDASDIFRTPLPAGTLKNLRVYIHTNSATDPSTLDVTAMKNGVATALTVAMDVDALGAGANASDTSNTVTFTADDEFSMKFVGTVNSGSFNHVGWSCEFQPDT